MMRPPVFQWILIAALFASSLAHLLGSSRRAWADEGEAADALAPGSWSVQFSVQPNFTLGSYSGSTLSLKRHLASGNALRFGLSIGIGNTSDDFTDIDADTFSTRTRSDLADGNRWSIGLAAYYFWYSRGAAPVHAYAGVGPTVSLSRRHEERTMTFANAPPSQPPSTAMAVADTRNRDWQVGAAGALGVEWLVARRVGLFAEYGSSLAYTSSKITRHTTFSATNAPTTIDDSKLDSSRWDFSGSGGRLGISAYF